jgi:hypothetical protein
MEHKVINRYALGDSVHFAEWQSGDSQITLRARFNGSSADGTIHFQLLRWNESIKTPGAVPVVRIPQLPQQLNVQISPKGDQSIAAAPWRIGKDENQIQVTHYLIGDVGELVEVEFDKPSSRPEIGFRQPQDRHPD